MLLHHLKHNKVLHEKVMLMSVVTEEIPTVDEEDRVECRELGEGFYQVIAHYGFMESPDIPTALALLGKRRGRAAGGDQGDGDQLLPGPGDADRHPERAGPAARAGTIGKMSMWRKRLFILMTRNARSATAFFGSAAQSGGGARRADTVSDGGPWPVYPPPLYHSVLCSRISRSAPQGVALRG